MNEYVAVANEQIRIRSPVRLLYIYSTTARVCDFDKKGNTIRFVETK